MVVGMACGWCCVLKYFVYNGCDHALGCLNAVVAAGKIAVWAVVARVECGGRAVE